MDETCMWAGDVHTHTHTRVMPFCAVYYCNHEYIAATATRKHHVFANSIQQPEIWSV